MFGFGYFFFVSLAVVLILLVAIATATTTITEHEPTTTCAVTIVEGDGKTIIPRVDGSDSRDSKDNEAAIRIRMMIQESARLLNEYGAVVIENLVSGADMDQLNRDLSKDTSATFFGSQHSFAGSQTTRNAGKPMGESHVAQQLAMNEIIVKTIETVLGPYCKRIILGTNSAINVVGPRSPEEEPAPHQVIHRDDSMWAGDWITNMACQTTSTTTTTTTTPYSFPMLSVSVMWAATNFTAENGATQVALKSHKQCPRTVKPTLDMTMVQATMPKGSVLLWAGGTFHGATSAQSYDPTREPRNGLLFIYNAGFLRSEHNFFHAMPHDVIMTFDPKLLDLMGYTGENAADHPWYVGPVYAQPYLGGPEGGAASAAGGEGVQYASPEPDSLWEG